MMNIDVTFLPADVGKKDITNVVCIVLDVFRATSSIVTAMANGCKTIIPASDIESAWKLGKQERGVLFAGERQSIKIEGFDFGNSPFEFSKDRVSGRTIVMTTTNGTAAIETTKEAYLTLIGSFINATAVCHQAQKHGKDIMIVCAGTEKLFSLEDAICAGLLASVLCKTGEWSTTDTAQGALMMYKGAGNNILETVGESKNGRRLHDIGRKNDVEYCLQRDSVNVVPQYSKGRINLAR